MNQNIVITGFGVCALVAAFWAGTQTTTNTTTNDGAPQQIGQVGTAESISPVDGQSARALTQKLDDVVSAVQQMQQRMSVLESAQASAAAQADESTDDLEPPKTLAELEQEENAAIEAMREEIRINYESQDRDEAWAGSLESNTFEFVEQQEELAGTNITQLDCRQSLCSLRAQHGNKAEAMFFREKIGRAVINYSSTIYWNNSELETVAYLEK